MDRLCKRELCTGCGACVAACPMDCVRMEADGEGFLRPVVDRETCIGCDKCRKACPVLRAQDLTGRDTAVYAAISLDEQVRLESTSGGVFTLLCRWVMEQNGIVFGAAYDRDFRVIHCAVEKQEDLPRLRGAKYAQSDLGDAYRQVRTWLKAGRLVLFSGTPCQVGGLVSYLGKNYENLILVDLICHGVPSPGVWRRYLEYRSGQDAGGKMPVGINLRSKETGWPGYSVRFDYPGGQSYSVPGMRDPYLRGFVRDLYLRPSCHHCRFKGVTRQSDVTLGDYWGVWDQLPRCHDGKGTSLVLIHTERGRKLWEALAGQMRFAPAPADALAENPAALLSAAMPDLRAKFWDGYETEDFTALIDTLCPLPSPPKKPSLPARGSRKMKSLLKIKSIYKW